TAARYLKAAGAATDLRGAVFAYNHANWYVDSVLLRAQVIAGLPANLIGSLTGLTEGRFPVAAKATYADEIAAKQGKRRGNAAVGRRAADRAGVGYGQAGAPRAEPQAGPQGDQARGRDDARLGRQAVGGSQGPAVRPSRAPERDGGRRRAAGVPAHRAHRRGD